MTVRRLVILLVGWGALSPLSLPATSVMSATESIRDVTTAFEQAQKAADRNNYKLEVASYRRARELEPNDAEIVFQLGLALARALEVEAARQVFTEVVRMDPRHAQALYMLARYARKFGADLADAIQRYRAVLAVNPHHPKARVELGAILLGARNLPAAEEMFAFVLRESPNDSKALVGMARIREKQRRYEEALRLLDTVSSLTDPQAEVSALRARCLKRLGKHEEAEKEFDRLRALSREDGALARFRREAHENASEPKRWLTYGALAYKFRRFNEAREALEESVKLKPDFAQAHSILGTIYLTKKSPDRALAHIQKAIELLPERGEEYNNLGICLLHQKKYAEAVEAFQTAIRLGVDNPHIQRNLKTAKQLAGKQDRPMKPRSQP